MELNQKINDAASKLMETLTKGYHWYHDTPEQPFEYTKGSIWLINPETEKWMLELKKSGNLWHYIKTSPSFYDYLNIRSSDFESFIELWVEDVLERGVISTHMGNYRDEVGVENVLKNGIQLK